MDTEQLICRCSIRGSILVTWTGLPCWALGAFSPRYRCSLCWWGSVRSPRRMSTGLRSIPLCSCSRRSSLWSPVPSISSLIPWCSSECYLWCIVKNWFGIGFRSAGQLDRISKQVSKDQNPRKMRESSFKIWYSESEKTTENCV